MKRIPAVLLALAVIFCLEAQRLPKAAHIPLPMAL